MLQIVAAVVVVVIRVDISVAGISLCLDAGFFAKALDVGAQEIELLLSVRIKFIVVLKIGVIFVVIVEHPFAKNIAEIKASIKNVNECFYISFSYAVRIISAK